MNVTFASAVVIFILRNLNLKFEFVLNLNHLNVCPQNTK